MLLVCFVQVKLVDEELGESLKAGVLKDYLSNFPVDQPSENRLLIDAPDLFNQISVEQVFLGQGLKNSSQICEPESSVRG